MANPLPVQQPAPRIIHYIDPAMPAGGLAPMTERELAARRAQDRILVARWKARQAAIAERDRKVRRFWLGFGVVFGLGALALVGGVVWFVVHAAVSLGAGLLAIPLAILALAGLAVGGHRCVTIVQHMH